MDTAADGKTDTCRVEQLRLGGGGQAAARVAETSAEGIVPRLLVCVSYFLLVEMAVSVGVCLRRLMPGVPVGPVCAAAAISSGLPAQRYV